MAEFKIDANGRKLKKVRWYVKRRNSKSRIWKTKWVLVRVARKPAAAGSASGKPTAAATAKSSTKPVAAAVEKAEKPEKAEKAPKAPKKSEAKA